MKFAKKHGMRSDLNEKGPRITDWIPEDLDVQEKKVKFKIF